MRAYFLDRIRVLLTILVIAHHSAITYGASGSWFFKAVEDDSPLSILLTIFAAINQAFFMGFFFLIAGHFTPGSLERKGLGAFTRDRLIRLGIPLLIFGFLLGPLTVAIATSKGQGFASLWLSYMSQARFVFGPMWFAFALLLFSAAYIVWTFIAPTPSPEKRPVPRQFAWIASAFLVGLAALVIRQFVPVGEEVFNLQLGYFASYIFLFAVGCIGARHGWITKIGRRQALPWVIALAVAVPMLPLAMVLADSGEPVVIETGFSGPAIFYAFWEPMVAWGLIALMLWRFRISANTPSALWEGLAALTYGAFILHPPVIVSLALLLQSWNGPIFAKFILLVLLGSMLSFLLAWLVRKIPGTSRVV